MDLNLNLSLDDLIRMKKNKARRDKQTDFRSSIVGSNRRNYGRHFGTNRGTNGVYFDGNRGGFGNVGTRNTLDVNIVRGGLSRGSIRYNGRGVVRRPMARHSKIFSPYINSLKVSIQFFNSFS